MIVTEREYNSSNNYIHDCLRDILAMAEELKQLEHTIQFLRKVENEASYNRHNIKHTLDRNIEMVYAVSDEIRRLAVDIEKEVSYGTSKEKAPSF